MLCMILSRGFLFVKQIHMLLCSKGTSCCMVLLIQNLPTKSAIHLHTGAFAAKLARMSSCVLGCFLFCFGGSKMSLAVCASKANSSCLNAPSVLSWHCALCVSLFRLVWGNAVLVSLLCIKLVQCTCQVGLG